MVNRLNKMSEEGTLDLESKKRAMNQQTEIAKVVRFVALFSSVLLFLALLEVRMKTENENS